MKTTNNKWIEYLCNLCTYRSGSVINASVCTCTFTHIVIFYPIEMKIGKKKQTNSNNNNNIN